MSGLPENLRTWASCPKCRETELLKRLNPIKRLDGPRGSKEKIVASRRVKCICGTIFYTDQGLRRENMGEDYGAGETSF